MSATWVGVDGELSERGKGMIAESGGWLQLSEGFRTRAEQEVFWNRYLNGGTLAARPGTSKHEKGLALDLACTASHNAERSALGRKWGLYTPVPGEPWHFELNPARQPILAKVPQMFSPAHVLRPIVAELNCPTGGMWLLGDDGSVYAYGGAPYLGGANGKTYFVGRKAATLELPNASETAAGKRYTIVSGSAERYSY